jgi:hypothetical protein
LLLLLLLARATATATRPAAAARLLLLLLLLLQVPETCSRAMLVALGLLRGPGRPQPCRCPRPSRHRPATAALAAGCCPACWLLQGRATQMARPTRAWRRLAAAMQAEACQAGCLQGLRL